MKLQALAPRDSFPAHEPACSLEPELEFIGCAPAFARVRTRLAQVAPTEATVLLLGETGTGKGLAARIVHQRSQRRAAGLVSVDCASLPPSLIESELFGRERGAFTDARVSEKGRFELADGGTIFLDEVGELPLESQAKLLRVIETGEFERLGSPRTSSVDVRVIAATNRDLDREVSAGRFRRDLYYRLSIFPIIMPPLRDRREDIPLLADWLVQRLARRHHRTLDAIPAQVLAQLAAYDWPGNVRELENVLERAMIVSPDTTLCLLDTLQAGPSQLMAEVPTRLVDVERQHIARILRSSEWRIEGSHGAAAALGLKPSTLRSRMRKLGLRRAPCPGPVSDSTPRAPRRS